MITLTIIITYIALNTIITTIAVTLEIIIANKLNNNYMTKDVIRISTFMIIINPTFSYLGIKSINKSIKTIFRI